MQLCPSKKAQNRAFESFSLAITSSTSVKLFFFKESQSVFKGKYVYRRKSVPTFLKKRKNFLDFGRTKTRIRSGKVRLYMAGISLSSKTPKSTFPRSSFPGTIFFLLGGNQVLFFISLKALMETTFPQNLAFPSSHFFKTIPLAFKKTAFSLKSMMK